MAGMDSSETPTVPYEEMEPKPGYSQKYKASCGLLTGILQILCGIAVFIFGVSFYVLNNRMSMLLIGCICGIGIFVITGIIGIISSSQRTKVIVAYIVLSIISALTGLGIFAWTAIWSNVIENDCNLEDDTCISSDKAVIFMINVVCVIQLFVGVCTSGYACRTTLLAPSPTREEETATPMSAVPHSPAAVEQARQWAEQHGRYTDPPPPYTISI